MDFDLFSVWYESLLTLRDQINFVLCWGRSIQIFPPWNVPISLNRLTQQKLTSTSYNCGRLLNILDGVWDAFGARKRNLLKGNLGNYFFSAPILKWRTIEKIWKVGSLYVYVLWMGTTTERKCYRSKHSFSMYLL